ncbi:MAG: NAD nucleotidase [Pseudomonadota bacterium]
MLSLSSVAHAQSPLTVNILHINDHHSHLQADDFGLDVSGENLSVTLSDGALLEEVEIDYGGYPLLTSVMAKFEAKVKNPIKIHAGDAITGTLFYSLFRGEADAALMNNICFDAFALGNHEFDDGDTGLANFLDFLATGDCNTPVLAANVVPGPDSALSQSDYLQDFTILNIEGQEVAIVGIDIAGKTKNSSSPDEDTEFLDETTTAQMVIDDLVNMGVNKIILATHIGYANDIELASNLTGVDVIVGGDSHSLLGGPNLIDMGFPVSGDYPTMAQDQNGNPVCIVQGWEYAHLFGRLRVKFDRDGNVAACSGHPVIPIAANSLVYEDNDADETERKLRGDDRKTVVRSLLEMREFRRAQEDETAVDLLAGFDSQVAVLEQTVIGSVAEDLCLVRWPGETRSAICERADTYENGSDISNIVARAFLEVSQAADFAIQNGGGVRVDVAAGDFTIGDAFTLLPFSNTLIILDMSGQQITDVLEDALSNFLDDGGSTGSYPYASGIRYDVDASAAFGSRISNVQVNPRLAGDWVAIDPNASYRVVTNDFIASGRDGYDTFGPIFAAGDFEDTFTEYAQGFIDYVEDLAAEGRSLEKLPIEEYSTQRYIGRDACDHSARTDCVDF